MALREKAYAYFDFSIGGYLLQAALAVGAGMAVLVRNCWNRIKATIMSRSAVEAVGEIRPAPSDHNDPKVQAASSKTKA